jgi:hypothetical protein
VCHPQHHVAVRSLDSSRMCLMKNEIHACLIGKVLLPRAWKIVCLERKGNTSMPNQQRTLALRPLLDAHRCCRHPTARNVGYFLQKKSIMCCKCLDILVVKAS